MSDKLNKFITNVLAGVVAADSLPDFDTLEDTDIEQYAADINKKMRQKLSSEFKGQYYSTATKELLRGLKAVGVLDDDQVSEFSSLKFDELTAQLGEVVKTKQAASMGESQKEVAAQIEKVKATIKAQYDAQMSELSGKLNTYQQKEYELQKVSAIKAALQKGFVPTDTQLKALNGLIGADVDIKFTDSGEPNLFYKGTDTVFGLNDKQILGLGDIVPKYLKDLGIWSEKPKPQTMDLSGGFKEPVKEEIQVSGAGTQNDRKAAAQQFLKELTKQ